MLDPIERTDNADTGQMLAQHAVQRIQLDLNRFEQRQTLHSDEEDRADQHRDHDNKDQGQLGVLGHRHNDPPDHHHRGADHHAEHHSQYSLYLGNIISSACNQ
ncbi:hypothetical protein D3C73_1080080 [compost metagenome]